MRARNVSTSLLKSRPTMFLEYIAFHEFVRAESMSFVKRLPL